MLPLATLLSRSLLVVVGNPAILARDPSWRELLLHAVKNGAYQGVELPEGLLGVMAHGSTSVNSARNAYLEQAANESAAIARAVAASGTQDFPSRPGDGSVAVLGAGQRPPQAQASESSTSTSRSASGLGCMIS
jgi:hypothetical protein